MARPLTVDVKIGPALKCIIRIIEALVDLAVRLGPPDCRPSDVSLGLAFGPFTTLERFRPMKIVIQDTQQPFQGTCSPVRPDPKHAGQTLPAKVDGKPSWSIVDEKDADGDDAATGTIATIEASEDGLSCTVTPTGKDGSFTVRCEADADLGSGVTELQQDTEFQVLPAEATALGVNFPGVGKPA